MVNVARHLYTTCPASSLYEVRLMRLLGQNDLLFLFPFYLISSSSSSVPSPRVRGGSPNNTEVETLGSSSSVMTPMDMKALKASGIIKSCQDFDLVVSAQCLVVIRERYSIPDKFVLHALLLRQRSYDLFPNGFSVSINTLEVGLQFPFHLVIEECLEWWRISSSQIVPNSWRYMIAFLGECRGAGIVPNHYLFIEYFRLCKGPGNYYLTA
ncbi:hypothetical protein BHM03_00035732 [Ensete ventricosum]|nr:hypothetical protein BHM03_00035732 [Ensete ventricosum]